MIQTTSLVCLLWKFRMRFGPHWPAPSTATRIIAICAAALTCRGLRPGRAEDRALLLATVVDVGRRFSVLRECSRRLSFVQGAQETGGIARNDAARSNALGHNRPGTNDCSCTDRNSTQNDCPRPNRRALLDPNGNHLPVGVGLQSSVRSGRTGE